MAGSLRDYTDLTTAVKDWIDDIAPKYFNFDQVANYRTGIFGYINEVMGTVTEDVFNAVSVARREFYPTHALYDESIYRIAETGCSYECTSSCQIHSCYQRE